MIVYRTGIYDDQGFPLGGSWHKNGISEPFFMVMRGFFGFLPLIRPCGAPSPQGEGFGAAQTLSK